MKLLSSLISLIAIISTSIAMAAQAPGQTARFLSQAYIGGLKLAIHNNSSSDDSFKKCVSNLNNNAIAQEAQQSLSIRFSSSELKQIDLFNLSSTGQRYHAYNSDFFHQSHGVTIDNPTKLTAEDVRILQDFEKTDSGHKYMSFLEESRSSSRDPARLAISALVKSCRNGP